ncbi:MAG: Gx transporter family protein [Bacillota bacterium]|nr:Gx transporter family protein [Bacillota bacterium]
MSAEPGRATEAGRAPVPGRQASQHERLGRLVLVALLFALALTLQWIEALLPPIPAPVPLKFGLSNIAVMYALFFLGGRDAYQLAVLKSGFVLLTRSVLPAAFSLAGGLLSVTVMLLLHRLSRGRISWLLLSVSGAITHNLGQFLVLQLLYRSVSILWVAPLLLVAGVAAGVLSAVLLRLLLPALGRLRLPWGQGPS